MKKIAVILSGCGVFDGSEIHEAVLTLLSLDKNGAEVSLFAPDSDQYEVIDHLTGDPTGETRNILVESARIARGSISPLSRFRENELDAVIFPGGYGAVKNLCDFAFKGTECSVNPEIETTICRCLAVRKPMGFLCIAPALLARISGKMNMTIEMTIGNDIQTAEAITSMGGKHIDTAAEDIIVDFHHRIVTTPAYMSGERIGQVANGIEKLVKKVLELCE